MRRGLPLSLSVPFSRRTGFFLPKNGRYRLPARFAKERKFSGDIPRVWASQFTDWCPDALRNLLPFAFRRSGHRECPLIAGRYENAEQGTREICQLLRVLRVYEILGVRR